MPSVTRTRSVGAAREDVWALVSDPFFLPRWWPATARVEDVEDDAWTSVLKTPSGKSVRADFTRVERRPQHAIAWRQELEESPFERILRESVTTVDLEPENETATAVELTVRQRARGFGRFGYLQLRRAAARQLDEALGSLAAMVERGER